MAQIEKSLSASRVWNQCLEFRYRWVLSSFHPGPEIPVPALGEDGLAINWAPPRRNLPGQAAAAHPNSRGDSPGCSPVNTPGSRARPRYPGKPPVYFPENWIPVPTSWGIARGSHREFWIGSQISLFPHSVFLARLLFNAFLPE